MLQLRSAALTAVILGAVLILTAAAVIYLGLYDVGADAPHTRPVFALMQLLRERSIRVRSKDIPTPSLGDEQLILKGAGQYAAMCTGCHLKPGVQDSEIRPGLYPQPPNLTQRRVNPQEAFWVIKHGLKMSAMPAWGLSHDDATIWSMVAFLQKLPDLTPAQYEAIVARAPPDEDMAMDMNREASHHHHGSGEANEGGHGHSDPVTEASTTDTAAAKPSAAYPGGMDESASSPAPLAFEGLRPGALPAAEGVAKSFHLALQNGDRHAALALLATEVTITEGGHTQSRDEYASGHLDEDIAFLHGARVTELSLGSASKGQTALVGSESLTLVTLKGKPTTLRGREMMTLRKEGLSWKIVAIQWRSTQVKAE